MKSILIPIEKNDLIESSMASAVLLARRFGSYIEGFALTPELNALMAAEGMGSIVVYPTDLAQQDQASAEEARKLFVTAMAKAAIAPATATPSTEASYGWNDRPAPGDSFVGSQGRIFDVTVVGRPGSSVTSPHMSTLETALFESGRPVLIAPPATPTKLGDTVTIAWNGSTESARTIAFAMPLLKAATRVVVLTVEDTGVPGPTGEEVARQLRRHDIKCETVNTKRGSRSSGAAILEEATAIGTDLLVKGAYTQSRLRQMIFGGATSHIIAEAQLPVLMAH
jgi:nucleotide-binding universal stress UspA family protein